LNKKGKLNSKQAKNCSLETDYDSIAISAKNHRAATRTSIFHDLLRFGRACDSLIQYAKKTTTFPCHFQEH